MAKNRILVVEDEQAISDFICMNLDVVGYEAVVFADGAQAAAALEEEHSYDLALLDVMLPGMDGFALFERMKEYGIPVIFLTAKADVESKVKGLKLGGEDYMVKPFEMIELLVRMEKVLQRGGKLEKVLRFGKLTVDIENRAVMKEGESISLKPMEFEVLVMLMRYRNRTLPRERLLGELWGYEYFGESRTVDVHIASLRKKLSLAKEIVTVSKIGYRLEEST